MSLKGYSWWDLFLQILSFFMGKKKEERRQEEQKQASEELKNEYHELDHQKEEDRKNELKDRMDRIFK